MEVLENNDQRVTQTLPHQYPLDRLQGAPVPKLGIELCQPVVALDDAQQPEQIGKRVLQRTIKRQNFAIDLLAAFTFIVLRYDLEIALEQVDDRKVRRGLAVRDRISLQH